MIGTRILHYQIEQKLGEGGMGEVYLATDTKLDRSVALKFLPTHLSQDPEFRARFEHEARAAAALHHPHIVTIYDLLEHEGRLFIAMEAITGESLDRFVARAEISPGRALQIIQQVCAGLEEAHEAGIVHRDIKPSNILIDAKGRARILDFGLAKSARTADLSKSGVTVGTLAYSSPEQLSGGPVDRRSDLYSLGAVLYQVLTGRPPFKGEYEEAVRYSILHDTPEPLARFKSDIPEELQRIVSKLLAKDPAVRYQSAGDVLADLLQLERSSSSDFPSLSRESVSVGRASGRRWPWAAAVVIAVVLILSLGSLKFAPRNGPDSTIVGNRLVVTYFDNLADPADTSNLGEMTAQLLIADLSEARNLEVVSSERLFDLRKQVEGQAIAASTETRAGELARRANARWMLLGTVIREKPAPAFSTQLVDASTGNAVGSQRVNGKEGEDLFALVDQLAAQVRADLALPSAPGGDLDPAVSNVTTKSEAAYRHYVAGLRKFYQYDIESARTEFARAQALDSTFAMAHFRFATADFLRRRGEIGLEALQKAVRHKRNATTRERTLIEAFDEASQGDYREAIDKLQHMAEQHADDKEAWLLLGGMELYLRATPSEAVNAYKHALQVDSSYGLAYNYLGYAYAAMGDWEKAMQSADRYLALSPGEPNPFDSKGDLYALQGQAEKAEAEYARARQLEDSLQLSEPPCTSCSDLGDLYLYRAEYARAERMGRQLMRSEVLALRHMGRFRLAFIPAYRGRFVEALNYLSQAAAADSLDFGQSFSADMFLLKSEIHLLMGKPDAALAELKRSLSLTGFMKRVNYPYYLYAWHIRCLSRLGNHEEASKKLSELERLLKEQAPRRLWLYNLAKGWARLEEGRLPEAVTSLEAARASLLSVFWGFDMVLYELASAYLAAGRVGEAIPVFETILNRFSTESDEYIIYRPLVHYQLGMAYELSGSRDRAVTEYRRFLNLWADADPGLPQLVDAQSRVSKLAP